MLCTYIYITTILALCLMLSITVIHVTLWQNRPGTTNIVATVGLRADTQSNDWIIYSDVIRLTLAN